MAQTSSHGEWVKNLLASVTAYSGVGYLATAYTISRWLTRSSPSLPERPVNLASNYEWTEVTCRTSDGLVLGGWVVSPPRPIGTIAIFHGLREDRTQALSRIDFLTRAGYRCVAFDHRAHGTSQGRLTSFGYFESRDAAAVLQFIHERWPDQPTAGLGISMGAAALCFAAHQGPRFDALVLESLYPRLANAFHNRVGQEYPSWFHLFRTGVIWITQKRLGVKIEQVAPIEIMPHLASSPLLLLTGSDDPHAPPEEVETLYHQGGVSCEFHLLPQAGHDNVCEAGGELYQGLVLDFLGRNLSGAALPFARAA